MNKPGAERNLTTKNTQAGKYISNTVGEKQQITVEKEMPETGAFFGEGKAGAIRLDAGITF